MPSSCVGGLIRGRLCGLTIFIRHLQAFERAAKAAGLGVVVGTLPGPRPMQLLRVTYE